MNEMLELMRRVVREELALQRGPQLATVSQVYAHQSDEDNVNYEADVRLKHDGLEIPKVPIAATHIGFAAPPRSGELVLLQFLDNDLQQPLITGRFYHDQSRAPLFREDDILFEHRLPDNSVNQLRMASDGSIFLQRDVQNKEDNSEFLAGIRIDPEGLIELKTGEEIVLTLDKENGLTVEGDVTINGSISVSGDGKISGVAISGTTIEGQ